MSEAYESLKLYIKNKLSEQYQTADFIKIPSVNERQAIILKIVSDKPQSVLTVKEMETDSISRILRPEAICKVL